LTDATQHQEASAARIDAAAAVRRLIHAIVGHHGTDSELAEVAEAANGLAKQLEQRERRVRSNDMMLRYDKPVPEGGLLTCWPDCMVAGSAHPNGTGLMGHREGDEVVASVTLGPAHEGPPGRAHGGMIASLFDEVFGFALWMEAVPAYTAWLKINYRKPVPLAEPLELRATVSERDGRKIFLAGTAGCGGEVLAEAEALFVVPREFASVLASEDG
jgi:acyl-coenzyme A thioesterase PaaI-like protein